MGLAKERFNFRGNAKFLDALSQLELDGKIEIVNYKVLLLLMTFFFI